MAAPAVPQRTMLHENTTFQCYESGCFWQGKGFDSAKEHWAACELVHARKALERSIALNDRLSVEKGDMQKIIDGHDAALAALTEENRKLRNHLCTTNRALEAISNMRMAVQAAALAALTEENSELRDRLCTTNRALEATANMRMAVQAALDMKAAVQVALAEGEDNMRVRLPQGMFRHAPPQPQKRELPASSANEMEESEQKQPRP